MAPGARRSILTELLVLYCSAYGHIEQTTQGVAEGGRAAVATADVKRARELVSDEVATAAHFKMGQLASIAGVEVLEDDEHPAMRRQSPALVAHANPALRNCKAHATRASWSREQP